MLYASCTKKKNTLPTVHERHSHTRTFHRLLRALARQKMPCAYNGARLPFCSHHSSSHTSVERRQLIVNEMQEMLCMILTSSSPACFCSCRSHSPCKADANAFSHKLQLCSCTRNLIVPYQRWSFPQQKGGSSVSLWPLFFPAPESQIFSICLLLKHTIFILYTILNFSLVFVSSSVLKSILRSLARICDSFAFKYLNNFNNVISLHKCLQRARK